MHLRRYTSGKYPKTKARWAQRSDKTASAGRSGAHRRVDSGGKQLSGSLFSSKCQKQTKSTAEVQNQQVKSQNPETKVKPLKQEELQQEDKVGWGGQKTWLIYTRGRGHTQVRHMRQTTCGGTRTKERSTRRDNTRGQDYQNKTGSNRSKTGSNPDMDVDGWAKGFQNRSMSVQHLQLKTKLFGCKLWKWEINKTLKWAHDSFGRASYLFSIWEPTAAV